jgi:hypothetical protein
MQAVETSAIVFFCVFGGALAGYWIRPRLPQHHLGADSRDLLKQGLAIIGTMTALIIGLLVASAKGSFDDQANEVRTIAAKIMVVDRLLANYGPEAAPVREILKELTKDTIDRTWGKTSSVGEARGDWGGPLADAIQSLSPRDENQKWIKAQALQLLLGLATSRWLIAAREATPIPWLLLLTIICWLTIIFLGMGLIAPLNFTNLVVLLMSAAAAAAAILLVLELYDPFRGFMQISPAPMRLILEARH